MSNDDPVGKPVSHADDFSGGSFSNFTIDELSIDTVEGLVQYFDQTYKRLDEKTTIGQMRTNGSAIAQTSKKRCQAMKSTNERMQKARDRREQIRASGETITQEHNLVRKANADPVSKVKAIAAACYQCFGGTEDELPDAGWKELIRNCTSPNCALYRHRPYR